MANHQMTANKPTHTTAYFVGCFLAFAFCSTTVFAKQSRVATPTRTNAKAPAVKAPPVKAPPVKAPAVKAPVVVKGSTTKVAAVTTAKTIAVAKTALPAAPVTTTKSEPVIRTTAGALVPTISPVVTNVATSSVLVPANPADSKTVAGNNLSGKTISSSVATIERPTPASIAVDAIAIAATGPAAVTKTDAQIAQAIVDLSAGKITAEELTRQLAGGTASASGRDLATQLAAGQPVGQPQMSEVTRLTIEAANQALAAIPNSKTTPWNGQLRFVGTDWATVIANAYTAPNTTSMLNEIREISRRPSLRDAKKFVRPATLEEIPPEILDARVATLPIGRREIFCLSIADCAQTSYLMTSGVMFAVDAKASMDPAQIAMSIAMLEEINQKFIPLQRPGYTAIYPTVAVTAEGDGVWLATGWGISAIVDILEVLGDSVPADLRARLDAQLRDEVKRIVIDWRDQRPWFVKSRCVVTNQWVVPTIGLIKACLFLKDPQLLPAYNLGIENLLAFLRVQGAAGEYLEGLSYAEMALTEVHDIIGSINKIGDMRCANFPFVENNWKWFAQMYMPGAMLVNCSDSPRSTLPHYCMTVPLASLCSGAMSSTDPNARSMMRFLYPNPQPIASLQALKFGAFVRTGSPNASLATLPTFAYFPNQQLVTWRSEFQPVQSPQTALGLWMKGGTLSEMHTHREQGQLSVYCGERVVLMNCGTPSYSDADYERSASAAGSNIMQVGEVLPHGQAVFAPLTVNQLDSNGGSVSIDSSGAYVGAICTRDITWNISGQIQIKDQVSFSQLVPSQTEFYKFHTGSDTLLQITGSGKNWIVAWQGVSMSITTTENVVVEQSTEKDAVMEPFRHQAIHIRAVGAVRGMTMTTDLAVDRAVTQ